MFDIKETIGALVQAFLAVSTWSFILAMYWNGQEVPAVVLGLGAGMLAKYGFEKVSAVTAAKKGKDKTEPSA